MPNSASSDLQRRHAAQHRIEFRPLGKLVLLDDLAREIARQHELDLAGHGLGVERGALLVALAVRPQEHVLAPVDQDARFGLVARRDEIDDRDRQNQRQHRRDDDPAALARQRGTQRPQIDIAGSGTGATALAGAGAGFATGCFGLRLLPCPYARTQNASHTPADATTLPDLRRLHSIKVAAGLIWPDLGRDNATRKIPAVMFC